MRFDVDWWKRTTVDMYIEEMSVFAHWLCMNNSCKVNLGPLASFPYTDWDKVRRCRHFAYYRDKKLNQDNDSCYQDFYTKLYNIYERIFPAKRLSRKRAKDKQEHRYPM